ncbi:MAG: serine hydrolase [Solirubrobacteraceae bacterium]|nr:serine hydrolase [Solirubrobacteraceae bacterium]
MPIVSLISLSPLVLTGAVATAPVRRAPDRPVRPKACVSSADIARARSYARGRPGRVSFAVYESGRIGSWGGGVSYRSASLVKAMLLVADLRRHDRLRAGLSSGARSRLSAMIRVSDNAQASATFNLVGANGLRSVARAAGMRNYTVAGYWGTSQLTASDQARFFGRLDGLLPARFRAYGRQLLRTVVPAQTWGGAPVARRHGFKTVFKSGWLPRTDGWVVHQGLQVRRGRCKVGLAVLTGGQPSMATGVGSIRGVVERLL